MKDVGTLNRRTKLITNNFTFLAFFHLLAILILNVLIHLKPEYIKSFSFQDA